LPAFENYQQIAINTPQFFYDGEQYFFVKDAHVLNLLRHNKESEAVLGLSLS